MYVQAEVEGGRLEFCVRCVGILNYIYNYEDDDLPELVNQGLILFSESRSACDFVHEVLNYQLSLVCRKVCAETRMDFTNQNKIEHEIRYGMHTWNVLKTTVAPQQLNWPNAKRTGMIQTFIRFPVFSAPPRRSWGQIKFFDRLGLSGNGKNARGKGKKEADVHNDASEEDNLYGVYESINHFRCPACVRFWLTGKFRLVIAHWHIILFGAKTTFC